VRRLISIALLLIFSFPLISPLFALGGDSESRLPVCCRRHGKHHCTMSAEQMAALLYGEQVTPLRSKCPLFPKPTVPVPQQTLFFDQSGFVFAEALSHRAQRRRTEASIHIALEGARHKRGPPTVLL
jgi:hypothetical protein